MKPGEAGSTAMAGAEVHELRARVAELESALQQALARPIELSPLLEQLPVGVALIHPDGTFAWCNSEARKYTGEGLVPSPDAQRRGRWDARDADGKPLAVEQWPSSRALRGETVKPGVEFTYTDEQGREKWLRVSSAPFLGPDGAMQGAIAIVEDIDQQKRAELALRESEERFRVMADSSPFLIWVCDPKGSIDFVNHAYREFTGQTTEESAGVSWMARIHPEDVAPFVDSFLESLRTQQPWTGRARVRRADGQWRWLESGSTPRFSPQGLFEGVVGSSVDITEQMVVEEAVSKREQQLRLITDSLPVLVSYIDANYCYRFANQRYTDWFGWKSKDLVGVPVVEVLGETAFQQLYPHMERALQGQAASIETLAHYGTGTRHIHATYEPDRDDQGAIRGIVVLVADISDRKEAEFALRESEARLKAAVLGSPNPIMLHAEDGEVMALSQSWCTLSGYHADQLQTREQWFRLAYPHSHDAVEARVARAFSSEKVSPNGELTIQTRSGEKRVWDFQAVPLGRLPDGRRLLLSAAVDVTDRTRAETALREHLALIEAITTNATTALFIADEHQHCLFMNPAAVALTGYTMEEMQGRTIHEVVHYKRPDGSPHPFDECPITRAFTEKRRMQGEEALVRKDGSTYPVSYSASPIQDPRGISGTIVELKDISAEKRMIEALRRRTEELETILNVVPVPVWIASDGDCRLITGNRTASQLFGIAPNSNLSAAASPETAARLRYFRHGVPLQPQQLPIERAAATGEPQMEQEVEVETSDGRRVVLTGSAVPLHDAAGNVRGVVSAMMDITARKQWEEQLRQSEERLRLATQTGKVGLWDWDIETDQITWTESLYEVHGVSGDSFDGTMEAYLRLVHPDDREQLRQAIRRSLEDGEPYQVTLRILRADGQVMWLYANAVVLRSGGRPVRMLGASLDITELKRVEEELRRVNQDLEQFAYTATHDLQEPLRGVKIYSELLAKRYGTNLDGQALQFLDFVRGGASRMEMLLGDLLAYTQLGKLDTPVERTDAAACLRATLDNLASAIAETGATITSDPLPHVLVYSIHLQQLFQNLIGNAIKYRHAARRPVIHIRAEPRSGAWQFSVEDNGIGIEPEYRERIFGLFKRLHTGDQYAGTGIGLAICQRIVERYQGRIWVESQPGEGSTFRFILPG